MQNHTNSILKSPLVKYKIMVDIRYCTKEVFFMKKFTNRKDK